MCVYVCASVGLADCCPRMHLEGTVAWRRMHFFFILDKVEYRLKPHEEDPVPWWLPAPRRYIAIRLERLLAECLGNTGKHAPVTRLTVMASRVAPGSAKCYSK